MLSVFPAHGWDIWLPGVCTDALQSVPLCPWWQWDSRAWRADPSQPGLQSLLSICSLRSLPVPQMTLVRVTGTALMEQFPNLKGLSVFQWPAELPELIPMPAASPCPSPPLSEHISPVVVILVGVLSLNRPTDRQTWRRMNYLEDMGPLTDLFVASLVTSLPAHLAVAPSVSTVKMVQMRENEPQLDWSLVQKLNGPHDLPWNKYTRGILFLVWAFKKYHFMREGARRRGEREGKLWTGWQKN